MLLASFKWTVATFYSVCSSIEAQIRAKVVSIHRWPIVSTSVFSKIYRQRLLITAQRVSIGFMMLVAGGRNNISNHS